MSPEDENFLHWVRSPGRAMEAVMFYSAKILRRKIRQLIGPRFFYPRGVRMAIAQRARLQRAADGRSPLPPRAIGGDATRGTLILSPSRLDYEGEPDWDQQFADDETYMSLHRWNWLLRGLSDHESLLSRAEGERLVRSWLQWADAAERGKWDTPYTRGERVSNLCVFLRVIRGCWGLEDADLRTAVGTMCIELLGDLEYSWTRETGNHPLNNGRALLLGGVCLGDEYLIGVGQAIVAERLSCLLEGGTLREESTHYHFLVTRWLLEIDDALASTRHKGWEPVRKALPEMIRSCWFFMVCKAGAEAWEFPLFGDISPDYPPWWLAQVPFEAAAAALDRRSSGGLATLPATGWLRLWRPDVHVPCKATVAGEYGAAGHFAAPEGTWHRVNRDGWTVFLKAEPCRGVAISSHGHCDRGTLVVYWNGLEVLADNGRASYVRDTLGDYGMASWSHNALLLNGVGLSVGQQRKRYPTSYWRFESQVSTHEAGGQLTLRFEDTGFRRLVEGTRIVRSVCVGSQGLFIEDRISGARGAKATVIYNWSTGWSVESVHALAFDLCDQFGRRLRATIGPSAGESIMIRQLAGSRDPFLGWQCREYGEVAPACATICEFMVTDEISLRLNIAVIS